MAEILKTIELTEDHSQIEKREYYQCSRIGWMQEKSRWKGVNNPAASYGASSLYALQAAGY